MDCRLEREVNLMQEGSHWVEMKEEERVATLVRGESDEQELLEFAELDKVKGEKVENVKEEAENEEQKEVLRVEQAKGKLKRVVEKKLKWKIEIVEEEEERGESNEDEEEEEGEVGRSEGGVLSKHCTNEISFTKQDLPGVNMLQDKSEGPRIEKVRGAKLDKTVKFGWREALAVDPLLANLHLKLDHIFFPKSKLCQVPFDM